VTIKVTLVSNIYVMHGLMLGCAIATAYVALPETTGRAFSEWRLAVIAVLAALSALTLIAYPAWRELMNPVLWIVAILAAIVGAGRGYALQIFVDHGWKLIRLPRAYDCVGAGAGLIVLALIEIALAALGPDYQPTMELGLAVLAAFLVGRSTAVLLRAAQEPQADLHDREWPPA
jgi:hypothetical protein